MEVKSNADWWQLGLVICSNTCMCLKAFALMRSSFDPQLMPGIALQRHPLLPHTHTHIPPIVRAGYKHESDLAEESSLE